MILHWWYVPVAVVAVLLLCAAWSYRKWYIAESKRRDAECTKAWNAMPGCKICGQRGCYHPDAPACPSCGTHMVDHNESASRICAANILARSRAL